MQSDSCTDGTRAVWYIFIIPLPYLSGKDFLLQSLSVISCIFFSLSNHTIYLMPVNLGGQVTPVLIKTRLSLLSVKATNCAKERSSSGRIVCLKHTDYVH